MQESVKAFDPYKSKGSCATQPQLRPRGGVAPRFEIRKAASAKSQRPVFRAGRQPQSGQVGQAALSIGLGHVLTRKGNGLRKMQAWPSVRHLIGAGGLGTSFAVIPVPSRIPSKSNKDL